MNKVASVNIKDITLVIPCNHPLEDLLELLKTVVKGTCLPREILIIESGKKIDTKNGLQFTPFVTYNVSALHIPRDLSIRSCSLVAAYPGNARNIGVLNSSSSYIAFLDVRTLPTAEWLERAWNTLEDPKYDGVWGVRRYKASTLFGGLIRDAIYGRRPVRSLSGSVFRKDIFNIVGQMISWAPAGEDVDWIHRIDTHKLNFFSNGEANHSYQGLDHKPFLFFVKKWWRYYHHSRLLPVNHRDRFLSYGLFYIILIFLAFNWNFKISVALLGSPLIIPHITTGLALAGPVLYVFVRGVYLPMRRGTPFLRVLPFRFFSILIVAFVLDLVKTLALLAPTIRSVEPAVKLSELNDHR